MVAAELGYNYCKIFSTIDFVKEIAKKCGWDGTKDARNRKFLSDLKDLLTEWDDVPLKDIDRKINTFKYDLQYYGLQDKGVVFIDCREPEEIDKLCKAYDAQTILVRRPSIEGNITSNHADSNVLDYDYDITIHNTGTYEHLKLVAHCFVEAEKLK